MYFTLITSCLVLSSGASVEAKKETSPAKTTATTAKAPATSSNKATPMVAPLSEADKVVAEAFAAPPPPLTKETAPVEPLPSTSTPSLWVPFFALATLAVLAWWAAKRKQRTGGMVRVLETTQLGPRRSLVVAQVQNETLLLACSEAGITILSNNIQLPQSVGTAANIEMSLTPVAEGFAAPIRNALATLFPSKFETPPTASFEQSLQEASSTQSTGEDEDLRAKLAAGLRGRKS